MGLLRLLTEDGAWARRAAGAPHGSDRLALRAMRALPAVAALALLVACEQATAAPSGALPPTDSVAAPEPPAAVGSPAATAQPFAARVEVVARGLEVPWSLAFAPDGRLFFTERPGRIRVVLDGQLAPEPVARLPAATSAESGLMGLALDPGFRENWHMYVMYTYRAPDGGLRNRVSRLTVRADRAGDERVLLDGIPGARTHDAGRIAFGPDGKLYVTTGDAAEPSRAQYLGSLAGKILRLNADGTVPDDNPFPGSPVYSYGHRNPQGLACHPETGRLYATEHGPTGDDEVNLVEPGQNYGWPAAQGGGGAGRFADPITVFNPAVAPSGATFYRGDRLAPWRGSLFFAALRGQHLGRLALGAPEGRDVEASERLFGGAYGRLREVVEGPDGALYVTTSNRDGRGTPAPEDDRVLRVVPADAKPAVG